MIAWSPSAERSLLVCLVRGQRDAWPIDALRLALAWDLGPLLLARGVRLTPADAALASQHRAAMAARNLWLLDAAARVSALFERRGVPHAIGKGCALLPRLACIDVRHLADVDLLVPASHRAEAVRLLSEARARLLPVRGYDGGWLDPATAASRSSDWVDVEGAPLDVHVVRSLPPTVLEAGVRVVPLDDTLDELARQAGPGASARVRARHWGDLLMALDAMGAPWVRQAAATRHWLGQSLDGLERVQRGDLPPEAHPRSLAHRLAVSSRAGLRDLHCVFPHRAYLLQHAPLEIECSTWRLHVRRWRRIVRG